MIYNVSQSTLKCNVNHARKTENSTQNFKVALVQFQQFFMKKKNKYLFKENRRKIIG